MKNVKLTKREFGLLERSLRSAFEAIYIENNELDVTLNGKDEPLTFSINWGCYGTQDVEEAERFVSQMNTAIYLAKRLNAMGIHVDYDAQDERITSKEDYLNCLEMFTEAFKGGSAVAFAIFCGK